MIGRAIMKGAMAIYCAIVYRIKVEGMENLPKEGNTIICSNHVHMLDSISLVVKFKTKRMIRVMAKEELFNTKFKEMIFREAGAFPIKRGKGDTEALEVAKNYIKDGDMLLMFPEGTRNGFDKGVKIKKGAAVLALSTNSVVVPVGIKGNYKPFTKIRIRIGKPINVDGYTVGEELNPREIIDLTNKMKDEIIKLRDGE
ncbi:MAG: 1-acyl-sn-glycerol-3-phosphate acyltransferase [Clostridia bacterium]|nr:1-acyl-sn-glycerol-3-phosphate acyltransferase [Clostridia bacterium]